MGVKTDNINYLKLRTSARLPAEDITSILTIIASLALASMLVFLSVNDFGINRRN